MKKSNREYFEQIFYAVCEEYEPISKAPQSAPNPQGLRGKELDKLTDKFMAEEQHKRYKALDYRTGNIKLMKNPLIMGPKREEPTLLMLFADAKKAAIGGKSSVDDGAIF